MNKSIKGEEVSAEELQNNAAVMTEQGDDDVDDGMRQQMEFEHSLRETSKSFF